MKTQYIYLVAIIFLLGACKPNIEEFSPQNGNVDFSSYVAIGNSLTAGYADGALYKSGQAVSYPNLLAGQFALVGGGNFKQPLMIDDYGIGFSGITPIPKLVLGYSQDCKGTISLAPSRADVDVNLGNLASIAAEGPFNNMAIPGLKSIHLGIGGYAALNPYFGRMVSAPTNSVMDEIMRVDATFFTIWLGSNDVLGYAAAGGVGDVITPVDLFTQSLTALRDYFLSKNMKGAIANVPDPTVSAYFTTIPYNALPITDQATADLLNGAYAPLNQIITGAGSTDTLHFQLGANPLVIADASLPWGMRQIKPGELLLLSLPQDSIKCAGWGSQVPVPGQYVLDATEISNVRTAVAAYNEAVLGLTVNQPIALVDANAFLKSWSGEGIEVDGIRFNASLVTGNCFSLDGLHLTPAGNALAANEFINAINNKFSANIPEVVVSDFHAVIFP